MDYTKSINAALREFSIGKKDVAYKKLKKIFNNNKDNDLLRFNLAVIEQSLNLNKNAIENYRYLMEKTNNYKAMINLYLLNIKEENYTEALEIINRLIFSYDEINTIIKDKAFILLKLKKYDESINICKNYFKKTKDINFLNILGLNYFEKKLFKKSEEVFKRALEVEGDNPFILNSLGRIYHEKRDSKNAKKYLERAFEIRDDSFEIINNLAGFYREEGNYKQSIDLYLRALRVNPNNSTIINNLAKAYFDTGKLNTAEEYCKKALNINENDGNIKKILSLIYLRKQNYKDGWYYFDGRLNLSDFVERNTSINLIRKKLFHKKRLDRDMKLLVLREQGVGDEILYGTMYRDLLDSCENVTIECDQRLKNIFVNSMPKYKKSFVNEGEISLKQNLINRYDFALYAGSLGKFFRNKIEDFNNDPFLSADKNLIIKIKKHLRDLEGKINIGLSWKSFKNRYASEKSLVLEDLKEILSTKNCNFINLQYGEVEDEIKKFNIEFSKNIFTIKDIDLFNDFDGLAALLKNLDLFITVSNSTAHLAGALGVKTLLIKPKDHAIFHYWNQPGNTTPWYKTITFLEKSDILSGKDILNKYLSI